LRRREGRKRRDGREKIMKGKRKKNSVVVVGCFQFFSRGFLFVTVWRVKRIKG